jgi:hypothetical protein
MQRIDTGFFRRSVIMLVLVGCSSSASTGTSATSIATTAGTSASSAPAAPSTDAPRSTIAASTTTTAAAMQLRIDSSPCALGEPPSDGSAEVTFVRDGRLYGVRSEPPAMVQRCLAELQPGDVGQISWGPQGDRYLIGNHTFVVGDKRSPTGFTDGQIATWSSPKGTAILRVDPTARSVAKRNNLDDPAITDLPVMSEAYDALYHPAGRNIAVVGRPTPSSTYGIWLISNDGENPKLITAGEDAKRIRLLRWLGLEGNRQNLEFYAEHLDGSEHFHHLTLPGLGLGTGGIESETSNRLEDLLQNGTGGFVSGSCTAGTTSLSILSFEGSKHGVTLPRSVRDARLITQFGPLTVATRSSACDGPEDLWVATGVIGDIVVPTKLVEAVTNIAVRSALGTPAELADDINAQAPG